MFSFFRKKIVMPKPEEALPGRDVAVVIQSPHFVLRTHIMPEFPEGTHLALFGMGCFWGVERLFWQLPGVYATAVGYSCGYTANPSYEEVCTGKTGHNEVVLVVYWPNLLSYKQLLKAFWGNHNPTQGMRQGSDRGTQYRSGIYFYHNTQQEQAEDALREYQKALSASGKGEITTEILPAESFYYAEDYHQQYLAKNPAGYCNLQSFHKSGLPEPSLAGV